MNIKNQFSHEAFEAMPVIGIMRNFSFEIIEKITPLYKEAGLTTLEVTMNSDGAYETIKNLSAAYPGLNIGAGTVCEMEDLHTALEAGASFIVTPILNEEVINYCVANKIPVFPGAFTPTEIYKAWKLGATAVKIFPASRFGPVYLKEIKAPLNNIRLLPTGGVSLDNIADFFKAGAMGAGMGSTLFDKEMISKKDFEGLHLHFKKMVSKVNELLKSH
jgi:2-dehydro-3-deoxyphosphogluconate aldolase/(4S)-4-hydroxy-2-oxoglutarate aldolase